MVLSVQNLRVQYGARVLFNDLSFTVEDGERIALAGHNGAGKSTLMKCLFGIYRMDEGEIFYEGQKVQIKDPLMALNLGIAMVHQELQPITERSVAENIFVGRYPMTKLLGFIPVVDHEKMYIQTEKLLKRVRMSFDPRQKLGTLSVSQMQSVEIAKAVSNDCHVLILDEPTAGLDPKGRDEILQQIKKLQTETGLTILLVSHSMEDVAEYVDRIIVMNRGSVMYDDTPREVFKHYKELEEVGLAAPQVTYIMHDLQARGADVDVNATTIEEAAEEIARVWKSKNT